mgnify:FL=1
MKLLLDTHTFLWFIENHKNLSDTSRNIIESSQEVYVSIVTPWEIAIKTNIGKLSLSKPLEEIFPSEMKVNNFIVLPITFDHINTLGSLPFHHNDPFDRMLIAQAKYLSLSIISRDTAFDHYSISRIW